jgi:hypothetical protein
MPDLVADFTYGKNISLLDRADVNGGCNWVVVAKLNGSDPKVLQDYLTHPEHKDVGKYQNPMLEGKFVVDIVTTK